MHSARIYPESKLSSDLTFHLDDSRDEQESRPVNMSRACFERVAERVHLSAMRSEETTMFRLFYDTTFRRHQRRQQPDSEPNSSRDHLKAAIKFADAASFLSPSQVGPIRFNQYFSMRRPSKLSPSITEPSRALN